MYDLAQFTLRDMTECATVLRTLGTDASCLEEAAERVVQYLFARLGDARTGQNGCALVRFFTTQPYGDLDRDTQEMVRDVLGRAPRSPALKCLVLTATAGEHPDWNDRSRSRQYKALPLAGPEFVAQFPMFAQLFKQFGVRVQTDVDPDSGLLMDCDEKTYNVFYVPEAKGSPFVPVQDAFVVSFGIRSVLGFGGILPSGNQFVVVLFAKVHVPRQTADLFKTLALSVKLALLGLDSKPALRKAAGVTVERAAGSTLQAELQRRRSQVETLEQLLAVHEQAVMTHALQRQEAEEALQYSEARLISVGQSTKDAIISINHQGNILFWSSGAQTMFGYSREDILGRPATRIIPDGFQEAYQQAVQQASAAEALTVSANSFESVGLRKDGTKFPLEFSLTCWKSKSVMPSIGMIRDMTERRAMERAEEALYASEERFRSLVSNIPGAVYRCACDPNRIMVFISETIHDLCGYPASDFYADRVRTYSSVIHPDDRTMVEREVFGAINEKRPFSIGYRLQHANANVRYVREQGQGVFDSCGQVCWIDGVIFDVTERNQAENALRESKEHFSVAFDHAFIGMSLLAPDGGFLEVNHALCRILGYAEEELLGLSFQAITHPDDLHASFAHWHRLLAGEIPSFQLEKRYIHKQGHIIWALVSVSFIRNPQGKPLYFITQTQDITERKRGEEALRQATKRFENQQSALIRLTHSETVQSSDLAMKLRYTTELAGKTLKVDRVSIWRYADDQGTIRCVDLYELHSNRHSSGHELRVGSYPAYFKALAESQIIAADDARRDPRTIEFADGYLSPHGIGSMMDVPIYHLGRLEGVMCCEHVGSRQWMQDEQMFAVALSNLVSLAYEQWEREQAERARRESDERFSTFMRHFPAVAFMKDTTGRHVYINECLEQNLGIARQDWYLKTNDDLFSIPVSATLNEHDLAVLKTGQSRQFIETTSQADGIHHWLVTKFPICDERGVPFLLGGVGIDITERRRAEEALRRSEHELADFFENGAVGLHWVGTDGIILKANKRELDLLGYTRDEYVGHHIAEFHADEAAVQDILRRLSAGETLRSYEARLRCKDGTVRHVLIDSNAYREDGNFVHSRCFTRDITEHKRAQERLRESEEFSQRMIASSGDCIKVLDLDGRVLWTNQKGQELMGIREFSEMQNSRWVKFWHDKDREAAKQAIATVLAGEAGSFQGYCPTMLGEPKWWDVIVTPIHNAQGEVHRLLSVARDVTARKGAEEQLQNSLSQLRTLSARLEAVREEERARIARELHDELGVGLTCHKIDLSRLSTMMGDAKGPEYRRKADSKKGRRTVDEKIRSMMEQVDTTIKAVQRIVTELRPGILDDLGLVAAIEWQTQDFQRRTGVACLFTPHEEDLQVEPKRATVIFRIFQEALTNVARHAEATSVLIRLDEQDGALTLDVQDNGRGIPEEKIFDHHSLGLLGMRERAALFGGRLEINGRPGKGTTITLRLPIAQPT